MRRNAVSESKCTAYFAKRGKHYEIHEQFHKNNKGALTWFHITGLTIANRKFKNIFVSAILVYFFLSKYTIAKLSACLDYLLKQMDETLKLAECPRRSLSWLAGKLSTITRRETQHPHSCSACKHRTKPWPHLEKQQPSVFGDVPEKKRRNSSMGCWLGALHKLSASSNSSSKGPGEYNREGLALSKTGRRYSSLAVLGCGPRAEEHQTPEQSRSSRNGGIVWVGKYPKIIRSSHPPSTAKCSTNHVPSLHLS